jgi:hypothetical protein
MAAEQRTSRAAPIRRKTARVRDRGGDADLVLAHVAPPCAARQRQEFEHFAGFVRAGMSDARLGSRQPMRIHLVTAGVSLALAACGGAVNDRPSASDGRTPLGATNSGAKNGSAPSVGTAADASTASGVAPASSGTVIAHPVAAASSFADSGPPAPGPGCQETVGTNSCGCASVQKDTWQCLSCPGPNVSTTVGTEGGEVSLVDAAGQAAGVSFSLQIPPHALSAPTAITVSEAIVPPQGFAPTTRAYRVEPANLGFAFPVTLHVPWGNTSGSNSSFAIYVGSDVCSEPQRLPDSYVNAGFLQGTITQTGIFFAGTPYQRPNPAGP